MSVVYYLSPILTIKKHRFFRIDDPFFVKLVSAHNCFFSYQDAKAAITRFMNLYDTAYRKQSEIDQLKRNLEQCENGYRQEMHLLQCKLADAKCVLGQVVRDLKFDVRHSIEVVDQSGLNPAIKQAQIEAYTDVSEYVEMLEKKYLKENSVT